MHEGEKDGVSLLLWMKSKYESEAKIDPLKQFYSDKLRSLKFVLMEVSMITLKDSKALPSCGGKLNLPFRWKRSSLRN